MSIIFYIGLTCLGILGKLWALAVVKRAWKQSELHAITAFFIFFTLGQSTFELIVYFANRDSLEGIVALKGYYFCVVAMMSLLPFIIAKIVRFTINSTLTKFILALCFICLALLSVTDKIISGVDHTGITLTRIPGPHYWLFQLIVLGSIIYTLSILILGKRKSNGFVKIRANNILLSFSFFALYAIFVVIMMQLTEGINAVGFLPIVVTLFVMGIIDNVCNENIVDYTYWIPFSKKRREINKLIKPFIEIQSDGLDPELKKEYNKLIAQHALQLFDGNQTKAAEWLKVSQSWVSRNNKNN